MSKLFEIWKEGMSEEEIKRNKNINPKKFKKDTLDLEINKTPEKILGEAKKEYEAGLIEQKALDEEKGTLELIKKLNNDIKIWNSLLEVAEIDGKSEESKKDLRNKISAIKNKIETIIDNN